MSVVVEQTIPWATSSLDLNNPKRWNTLFPLIRPSVSPVTTNKGQTILIDHALATSPHIQIVAVSKSGNFSSKFLSDRHIAAIVTETAGAGILTGHDLRYTLEQNGLEVGQGLVVVRAGKEGRLELLETGVVEVETEGELEFDHVLSLLEHASETVRTSIHQTTELLKLYLKTVVSTKSEFHTAKRGPNASVVHAGGHSEFETAKKALEKDLTHVLRPQACQAGGVVYSVHFSDINGLSQLENYILAHEISDYFDAQNIPYHLSSSPLIASHPLSARGWAISVCALPSHFISPTPKPPNPLSQPSRPVSTPSPVPSIMKFEDDQVRSRITRGCTALIAAEPTVTHYDTIVGDGDCGLTLRDGAQKVLSFISSADLAALPSALAALVDALEVSMGGTSGALYCIFLSALSTALQTAPSVPEALQQALAQLLQYTRAREGDRTCLDALIPFVDVLASGGRVEEALSRARRGVEATKSMEAKLGRSTYLDASATRGVPDPGAYGLLVLLEGLCEVSRE